MITQISDKNELIFPDNYYGNKLSSLLDAYGTGYDFCRFYKSNDCFIGILNSSMVYTGELISDIEEFETFVGLNSPSEIEMPLISENAIEISGYNKVPRVMFEFSDGDYPENMDVDENPKLNKTFEIVKDSFGLEKCYDLWLTDTSHRIRHGVSQIYLWEKTTAACYFVKNKIAFFGQIATATSERGKGNARKLLYWIYNKMKGEGIRATLFAQPHRTGFYKEIGFKEIYNDFLFVKEE
ncbi:MAG TPA: hypothetical protein PKI60_05450 [Oscillospiraceae bacterium]|nr:hypothetical protein [Oscillospiraceae bacterium]